jgi:hypothetical protein
MTRTLCATSALAIASALACSAHAATLIASTSDQAWAQATAAQPGDHVQLQSGTYRLDLWAIKKTGEVVIEPAPGATVVATEINADGSAFLTFRNIPVNFTPSPGTSYAVDVQQATNITLDGLKVSGSDCVTLNGVGAWFRGLPAGSNVVLKNSTFKCLGAGIGVYTSDGLSIIGNDLQAIQTDGMILTGATNVLIRGNTGSSFHTAGGGHPDFIQWANNADQASAHITIDGNRFERGQGDLVQGVFGEDATDVTIANNILIGTMYHGISAARTQQLTVADNYVQPLLYTAANPPPGQGEADMGDWIMVRMEADHVTLTCNAAPSVIVGVPSDGVMPTNVTQTGTTITHGAAPGDYSGLIAWHNTPCAGSATVSTPVPPPVVVTPPATQTPVPDPLQPALDAANAQNATLKAKIAKAQAALAAYPSNTAKQLQTKIANALAALK